jgi:hypothetical protein
MSVAPSLASPRPPPVPDAVGKTGALSKRRSSPAFNHVVHKRKAGRSDPARFNPEITRNLLLFVVGSIVGRRDEALETAQKVFLGHAVECDLAIRITAAEKRNGLRLGLVDLDVFLH